MSWLSLDDQLWHQCLATYRRHQEVERATGARASPDWAGVQQTDDDRVLLRLLDRGISNQSAFNRPFDASTCSMRFAAVMGDRLWSLLERERLQVRNHSTFVCLCQMISTGGKGWCTWWVHCKYIARKWIKYPPKTHPVHCKHIQNFLSQFHCSVPSAGNAQYIHSVPGHVIAVFPLGNPWGNLENSQRKYPQYSQVAH